MGWTVRGSNLIRSENSTTRPDLPWGPLSLIYNRYRVPFPEVKRQGRDVDHPPPSNAEFKERVELYIYSSSGPSWHVLGWPLPLHLQALCYVRLRRFIMCEVDYLQPGLTNMRTSTKLLAVLGQQNNSSIFSNTIQQTWYNSSTERDVAALLAEKMFTNCNASLWSRGEFRPRQTRQLPRAVELKGRLLSCQSY